MIGDFVWASGDGREKVCGTREKFRGKEGGARREIRFLRVRGSAELEQVVSNSATQGLWLRNKKIGSQVVGEDQSRLLAKKQLGELENKEDEKEEPARERK